MKVGYNPKYVKVVEDLVKRRYVDIVSFRKQLKLPTIEDPRLKKLEIWKSRKIYILDVYLIE